MDNYLDFKSELKNLKVIVVPIVIGAQGTIPISQAKHIKKSGNLKEN